MVVPWTVPRNAAARRHAFISFSFDFSGLKFMFFLFFFFYALDPCYFRRLRGESDPQEYYDSGRLMEPSLNRSPPALKSWSIAWLSREFNDLGKPPSDFLP